MATGTGTAAGNICPLRIRFLGDSFPEAREILAGALAGDDVGAWPAGVPAGPGGTADVLIPALRRVDRPVMDAVRPALIQQFGGGLDGVDLEAATARRIPVANVPGDQTGGAGSVAELAMLHLLALSRRFDQARARLRNGLLGTGQPRSGWPDGYRHWSWGYRPGGPYPAPAVPCAAGWRGPPPPC